MSENLQVSTKRLEDFLALPETINILPEVRERIFESHKKSISSSDSDVRYFKISLFSLFNFE